MRVFVFEFVCSGAAGETLADTSLATEGRAMLTAVAADFARIPGVTAVTCCDRRLRWDGPAGVEVHTAGTPEEELRLFRKLAAACHAAFLIAPEFDDLLAHRRRLLDELGTRCLGCTQEAVALCGDKLRLAEHLQQHHLPTIPTRWCGPRDDSLAFAFPVVIKPQDGAGSQDTFVIRSPAQYRAIRPRLFDPAQDRHWIVQPYIAGQDVSIAVLASADTSRIESLPLAAQHLSRDDRLRYLGGSVPAESPAGAEIRRLVARACRTIPGLAGYVGFDVIVPHDGSRLPLIVEVNPRLTTSYLGYRLLARDNLAERLLFPERFPHPIAWKAGTVTFRADGTLTDPGAGCC